jgi:hypothetical protein
MGCNQCPVIRNIVAGYPMSTILFWESNGIVKLDAEYTLIRSWWILIGGSQLPFQIVCCSQGDPEILGVRYPVMICPQYHFERLMEQQGWALNVPN